MDTVWTLAKVVLGLEVIVLFHLFGHLLAAKFFRVPLAIHLGFGWAIPGCRISWGRTSFVLAWFPLGGYATVPLPKEAAEVPRVWRRLFVASGGVIMNVILAWLCFTLCWSRGMERSAAVIGLVNAGSPAWTKGLPTGAVIEQIGDIRKPTFEDLMSRVMGSRENEELQIVYSVPGNPNKVRVEIMPRLDRQQGRPMLGVSPASSTRLVSRRGLDPRMAGPVIPGSPAASADPPFAFDDVIIGTTDPDNPEQIKQLPEDPRNPGSGNGDYFEWLRRLRLLAGKEITVQVRRADGREEKIRVPPAFHLTLSARMQMGEIAAVREGSAGEKAGIQTRDRARHRDGDRIVAVEIKQPDGKRTKFDEDNLDPMRLRYELRQWSRRMVRAGKGRERIVTLTLLRHFQPPGPEFGQVTLQLPWDSAWESQRDHSFSSGSPLSIPELGIAYDVLTTVAVANADGSLQPGDEIVAIRAKARVELDRNDWPWALESLQQMDTKDLAVDVIRNNVQIMVVLKLTEDKTWPVEDRGLILARDLRLQSADDFLDAMRRGLNQTGKSIGQAFTNLQGSLTGRIDPRNLGGPVVVTRVAVRIADYDLFAFIFFLALIGLNFSLINLLPIPILDGGEALLLLIEKLSGQPLPTIARRISYGVGAAFLSLALLYNVAVELTR